MSEPSFKDDHEDTFDFLAQYLSPKHPNSRNTAPLLSNHQQPSDANSNKEEPNNIIDAKTISNANTNSNITSDNVGASSNTNPTININPTINPITSSGSPHSSAAVYSSSLDSNKDNKVINNVLSNGKEAQSTPSLISLYTLTIKLNLSSHFLHYILNLRDATYLRSLPSSP
jgi:hypothetical protein